MLATALSYIGNPSFTWLGIAAGAGLVLAFIGFLKRQERRAWDDFAREIVIDDDNTRGIGALVARSPKGEA